MSKIIYHLLDLHGMTSASNKQNSPYPYDMNLEQHNQTNSYTKESKKYN